MTSGPSIAPSPQHACSQVMTRGVKRVAAKALTAASIAPAPRPDTKPKATITAHHGVTAHVAALVATQQAARDEQTADAEALEHGPGAEAGGEVARHHREQ